MKTVGRIDWAGIDNCRWLLVVMVAGIVADCYYPSWVDRTIDMDTGIIVQRACSGFDYFGCFQRIVAVMDLMDRGLG